MKNSANIETLYVPATGFVTAAKFISYSVKSVSKKAKRNLFPKVITQQVTVDGNAAGAPTVRRLLPTVRGVLVSTAVLVTGSAGVYEGASAYQHHQAAKDAAIVAGMTCPADLMNAAMLTGQPIAQTIPDVKFSPDSNRYIYSENGTVAEGSVVPLPTNSAFDLIKNSITGKHYKKITVDSIKGINPATGYTDQPYVIKMRVGYCVDKSFAVPTLN